MFTSKRQPIFEGEKTLIPIEQASEKAGISVRSMSRYGTSGIVEQVYREGFRYIVESSITNLKANPPPAWNSTEWTNEDGTKFVPISRGAAMLGIATTTLARWIKTGKSPLAFNFDSIKRGSRKKRIFVAEDSVLALAHIMQSGNSERSSDVTKKNSVPFHVGVSVEPANSLLKISHIG